MKLYDCTYPSNQNGHNDAIEYLRGMVWCEVETTEQDKPGHSDYIESFEGVDLYYCYGADYYFFADDSQI